MAQMHSPLATKPPPPRLTAPQRLEQAFNLFWTARALKEAWLRQSQPEAGAAEIQRQLRRWVLFSRS
ncbi:MAG: hypothetical protein HY696_06555 [Deltaproteobacteria bacterium]|nr:hypothetical protein [Deltaproteobacteria bacterium]